MSWWCPFLPLLELDWIGLHILDTCARLLFLDCTQFRSWRDYACTVQCLFLPSYLFNWSIFSLLIDMLTAFDSHSMFANNWPSIKSRCISRQNVDICPSWPSFSTLIVVGVVLLTVSFYCPSLSLWDQMLAQHQALNWTNTHTLHRGELVAGQLFLQSTTLFLQHCVIQVVFQPKYSNIVEHTGGELVTLISLSKLATPINSSNFVVMDGGSIPRVPGVLF